MFKMIVFIIDIVLRFFFGTKSHTPCSLKIVTIIFSHRGPTIGAGLLWWVFLFFEHHRLAYFSSLKLLLQLQGLILQNKASINGFLFLVSKFWHFKLIQMVVVLDIIQFLHYTLKAALSFQPQFFLIQKVCFDRFIILLKLVQLLILRRLQGHALLCCYLLEFFLLRFEEMVDLLLSLYWKVWVVSSCYTEGRELLRRFQLLNLVILLLEGVPKFI